MHFKNPRNVRQFDGNLHTYNGVRKYFVKAIIYLYYTMISFSQNFSVPIYDDLKTHITKRNMKRKNENVYTFLRQKRSSHFIQFANSQLCTVLYLCNFQMHQ